MQKKIINKGRNIYTDDKGRTVLYIPSSGIGYYVPRDNEQKLFFFQNRYLISIATLILLVNFLPDKLFLSIGIACTILIVIEIMYKRFINTLDRIKKFEAPERSKQIDEIAETYSKKDCITRGIAMIVFGILLVLNAMISGFSIQLIVMNGIVCFACVIYGILHLAAARMSKQ